VKYRYLPSIPLLIHSNQRKQYLKDFDNNTIFISGVVDFLKDIGWINKSYLRTPWIGKGRLCCRCRHRHIHSYPYQTLTREVLNNDTVRFSSVRVSAVLLDSNGQTIGEGRSAHTSPSGIQPGTMAY
jgi:hypothetical protein